MLRGFRALQLRSITLTYMAYFNHDLVKPTYLLSNLRTAGMDWHVDGFITCFLHTHTYTPMLTYEQVLGMYSSICHLKLPSACLQDNSELEKDTGQEGPPQICWALADASMLTTDLRIYFSKKWRRLNTCILSMNWILYDSIKIFEGLPGTTHPGEIWSLI